jgi:phosphoenolpyruvate-protein phosphotransferase (PTS system enzyme I)
VQLDRDRILGLATDAGTRTSHSAILARSLGLPAVVSLGDLSTERRHRAGAVLDGREGRVIIEPTDAEKQLYRERDFKIREWEQELILLAHLDAVTPDHQPVLLRANIDLPGEAAMARSHGARGIGLYRTEFFVVGRSTPPEEEEQYRCYREVLDVFPTTRLHPHLRPGRRQVPAVPAHAAGGEPVPRLARHPRLPRHAGPVPPQLRALLRATAHGDVRIMLPLVNESRRSGARGSCSRRRRSGWSARASRSTPATSSAS